MDAEQIGCGERPICTAWTIRSSCSSSSSGTRSPWLSSLPTLLPDLPLSMFFLFFFNFLILFFAEILSLFESLSLRWRYFYFLFFNFWYEVENWFVIIVECVCVVETMGCKKWCACVWWKIGLMIITKIL